MKLSARIILYILIAAAVGAGLWLLAEKGRGPGRHNVVIITIDTLRADHVGCCGAPADYTPALDSLARDGLCFTNAVSAAFGTTPSHASIFTSTHSKQHGVYNNMTRLGDSSLTLAEILWDEGYSTAAFVSAVPVLADRNLGQGFDVYNCELDPEMMEAERRAGAAADAAIRWLSGNPDRPVFLWVHFFDPHLEYAPPAEFREKFLPDEQPGGDNFIADQKALYAAEAAYADSQAGRVINWFRDNGLYDDTLFIVVGDHGESLDEFRQGENFHHHNVYQEVVNVPMIARFPGKYPAGLKSGAPVSTLDIVPTVLEFLGVAAPPNAPFRGRSLMGTARGEQGAVPAGRYLFFETGNRMGAGVIAGGIKYLHLEDPARYYRKQPFETDEQLFDLRHDPGEKNNLALNDHPSLPAMRRLLADWRGTFNADPAKLETINDPAQLEKLKQLGYVE